ncbi:MAG: 30S ribosomal protein S21 [Bacteroidota bacterium]
MRESNIVIRVKDNETVDRALKRFKKKFEKVGILKKLRKRMFYKKPSMEQREQRLKAIYRQKMQTEATV